MSIYDRINAAIEAGDIEWAQLLALIAGEGARVEERINAFNGDVDFMTGALNDIGNSLTAVLGTTGVKSGTASLIRDGFLVDLARYLDPSDPNGFPSEAEAYRNQLRQDGEHNITVWNGAIGRYLQYRNEALANYQAMVAAAQTADELNQLADEFPMPEMVAEEPLPPEVENPLPKASDKLAEGYALRSKAEEEIQTYQPIVPIVKDLAENFGLGLNQVNEYIDQGLIQITVKGTQATVTIDSSVNLPAWAVNLTDPLGPNKLPSEIHYTLGTFTVECDTAPCPGEGLHYYVTSGSFYIGEDYYVELQYFDNASNSISEESRLKSVKIYDGDPYLVCIMAPCPTGKLVKEISYWAHDPDLTIVYHDGSQGDVASRDVTLQKDLNLPEMEDDGQHHIQTVIDLDKDEKVISKSELRYGYVVTGYRDEYGMLIGFGPLILRSITRTDADGNPLYEITDIQPNKDKGMNSALYQANVAFPDGNGVRVIFNTLEELFFQALKAEETYRAELVFMQSKPAVQSD